MNWKKIWKALFFPHIAIIILLCPLSIAFLTLSLVFYDSTSAISIVSYLFAFYILLVICLRIPRIIAFCKRIKKENKFIHKYTTDVRLRITISLYGSLIFNGAYAILQLCLGFYHGSLWFYSMSIYYTMLTIMRFFLLRHTRAYDVNQDGREEGRKCCLCGWIILALNLALAVIISFIVVQNKTFHHHEITTIALATYTFVTFTFAIVNLIRYRKYNSMIYSCAKTISLICACVSMLTLESTMLTTFGGELTGSFAQIMLACSGGVVTIFTITMAIILIVRGMKKLRSLPQAQQDNEKPNLD